jgi:hypothetical protein
MEEPVELQDSGAVVEQLGRVLESPVFASSVRMQRFLRFIVEARLGGDLAGLKETSVGIAVFDREPGYDPQTDAIVRVEARRLRSKLQQYYNGIGVSDSLVIQLPTGTYRPEFVKRELPPEPVIQETGPVHPAAAPLKQRRVALAAGGLLLLAAGFFLGVVLTRMSSDGNSQTSVVPLTSYPGQEFDPRLSPDGKQLAFVWDGNSGHYNVYTKLLQVGNPVRVTFGAGHDLHPSWSPDGQYLAFLHVSPTEKALRNGSEASRPDAFGGGHVARRCHANVWKPWPSLVSDGPIHCRDRLSGREDRGRHHAHHTGRCAAAATDSAAGGHPRLQPRFFAGRQAAGIYSLHQRVYV